MFFDQPEPIESDCDAPPYPIVRACRRLGFRSPEDVRWCRMTVPTATSTPRQSVFSLEGLKAMFRRSEQPKGPSCVCGQELPHLDRCSFTLSSGRQVDYLLGQCSRCQAIFWQEARDVFVGG